MLYCGSAERFATFILSFRQAPVPDLAPDRMRDRRKVRGSIGQRHKPNNSRAETIQEVFAHEGFNLPIASKNQPDIRFILFHAADSAIFGVISLRHAHYAQQYLLYVAWA